MLKDLQIKDIIAHIKEFFGAMSKKKKMIIGAIGGGVILFAIGVTLVLNMKSMGYRVLYTQLDAAEASNVYQTLKELGAAPQMNAQGQIMVPSSEYDVWLLQLAGKGFPQSTPTYDVFASHSGMTATETEKAQWLIYQLQDRIQETLKRLGGVENAVVTITTPNRSDYIWDQATNKELPTAGVLLTLQSGASLTTEQITSIKNLIASSVPQMLPADVTVVNAKTSLELSAEGAGNSITAGQNLQFEQMVQQQIEDNIVRVLTPRYGANGVVATAKVTINYDKMVTEEVNIKDRPLNPDGTPNNNGYPNHTEGTYGANNAQTVGGIAGEETNTDIPDIPTYGYTNPGDDPNTTYYTWNTDIDYPYIKTQIEKGQAALQRATVSVMVDEPRMNQARRTELTNLISKSADIAPELIVVSAFDNATDTAQGDTAGITIWNIFPPWVYLAFCGVLLLAFLLLIVLSARRKRKKRQMADVEQKQEEEARELAEQEINTYKKQLFDAAKSGNNAKEDAILDEIRGFAQENPEITANLLRSWLKEGEH